eukprot:m.195710 g.195710  ORF g.195710 m.195710 type:complete len:541 (-) comp19599_c0_seq1:88-1710(-)
MVDSQPSIPDTLATALEQGHAAREAGVLDTSRQRFAIAAHHHDLAATAFASAAQFAEQDNNADMAAMLKAYADSDKGQAAALRRRAEAQTSADGPFSGNVEQAGVGTGAAATENVSSRRGLKAAIAKHLHSPDGAVLLSGSASGTFTGKSASGIGMSFVRLDKTGRAVTHPATSPPHATGTHTRDATTHPHRDHPVTIHEAAEDAQDHHQHNEDTSYDARHHQHNAQAAHNNPTTHPTQPPRHGGSHPSYLHHHQHDTGARQWDGFGHHPMDNTAMPHPHDGYGDDRHHANHAQYMMEDMQRALDDAYAHIDNLSQKLATFEALAGYRGAQLRELRALLFHRTQPVATPVTPHPTAPQQEAAAASVPPLNDTQLAALSRARGQLSEVRDYLRVVHASRRRRGSVPDGGVDPHDAGPMQDGEVHSGGDEHGQPSQGIDASQASHPRHTDVNDGNTTTSDGPHRLERPLSSYHSAADGGGAGPSSSTALPPTHPQSQQERHAAADDGGGGVNPLEELGSIVAQVISNENQQRLSKMKESMSQ